MIWSKSKMQEHLFLQLNKVAVKDSEFDEISMIRSDFQSLIK